LAPVGAVAALAGVKAASVEKSIAKATDGAAAPPATTKAIPVGVFPVQTPGEVSAASMQTKTGPVEGHTIVINVLLLLGHCCCCHWALSKYECIAVCCSVLPCCSVLRCVAVCFSVLHCVAVCCRVRCSVCL